MKVVKTPQFDVDQLHIEDHIFESNEKEVKFVEKFIEELDAAVKWIQSNTATPKEDEMGDRSWPFYRDPRGLFRYRLKYIFVDSTKASIILKRIIDNREQNLDIYPVHKLDSFSADDE
ncbi:MAG: hypothetical protein AB7O96_11800 [Pseudobdellovibrionaceae bacterium]